MGSMIGLMASDGFELSAYRSEPNGKPRGGLVLVQEVFGVNGHIRSVADDYAAEGYLVVAPSLFDRVEVGVALGYDEPDIQKGVALKGQSSTEDALLDISAAQQLASQAGKVGVIGYCWGGLLSWLSATRLPGFAAAVVYYGGGIGQVADERPGCPVIAHFGESDHAIPMTDVDSLRNAQADNPVQIYVYPAGHGFNCSERRSFDQASSVLARDRTLAFLRQQLV